MPAGELGSLAVLALVDATSAGTLFIPVWLLLRRVPARTVGVYLATVAVFYAVLGLGLLAAGRPLVSVGEGAGDRRVLSMAQLGLGVGLFAFSFRYTERRIAARRARRATRPDRSPTRVDRLKAAVVGEGARPRAVIALGLVAGVIEAASMVPYLGAIGLLSAADLSIVHRVGVLVGYVAMMTAPALLLVAAATVGSARLDPVLGGLDRWFDRHGEETVGWVVGIAGFFLAGDALGSLGWIPGSAG